MFNFPTSPKEAGKGTMITFVSVRQGNGASSLACLAALSAVSIKKDVSIIDFNPESRVRVYFGYPGAEVTPASVLNIASVSSPDMIYSACEEHHSGVKVFPGVIPKVTDATSINGHLILRGATFLKQKSPLTVAVSGPLYTDSWILPMISDLVCVVVRPDRPSMDAYRETMEYLGRLGCVGRIRIILNQQGYPGGIAADDSIKWFSPDIVMPYSKQYAEACNKRALKPDNKAKDVMLKLIREAETIE